MSLKLIECPRDAMQGLHNFIPTDVKADYINQLLKVGYDTIDFGSFVSPKAIPQMRDTTEVLSKLDIENSDTKLLAIIANTRGAEDAARFSEIDYLGYPFSISETFQLRNTNATMAESIVRVEEIQEIAVRNNKQMVIYISMGFGNPYGDTWNVEIAQYWVDKLADMGIRIIALSDTIGIATPESISYLFKNLIPPYPDVEFGAHLHSQPFNWLPRIEAAYNSGCRRFDAAIRGYGGCPMAKDDLTGNMATENLLQYFDQIQIETGVKKVHFKKAIKMADSVFKNG
ncbi:MAG TPA: hydroxymethylglutaryl-CoA lyase [Saprospiraceae bacterium]|nr:hydroxymethylglutaryl-CoA lyase [Saprospiraceae bacterium]HRO73658.1 hydroxymethylglutaryl-CoA lyase [Saprospiraceae bacterium]HRP41206.1 hydroxymethylglutaryl-CoA lyase [Saprospiraceae bacterium]